MIRRVDITPRMRELLESVTILARQYEGEFVCDATFIFMPADGKVGEEVECSVAHARFGKFRDGDQLLT